MKYQVIKARDTLWYIKAGLCILVISLLLFWLGMLRGEHVRGTLLAENEALKLELADDKTRLAESLKRIAALERSEELARAGLQQAGEEIEQLQDRNNQLEKELSFYRSIMAPELDKKGLTIDSLEVRPDAADRHRYHFRLVLTQAKKQDWYLKGSFRLTLHGEQNGSPVQLTTSQILDKSTRPTFSFRYFQRIEGIMTLPEGFAPHRIVVVAQTSNGREKAEASFPWPSAESKSHAETKKTEETE